MFELLKNIKDLKFESVLERLGFFSEIDTMQLCDDRTRQIIDEYEIYKNAPWLAFDCEPWFYSVKVLNKLQNKPIF